jgi:hypothetical protein
MEAFSQVVEQRTVDARLNVFGCHDGRLTPACMIDSPVQQQFFNKLARTEREIAGVRIEENTVVVGYRHGFPP